MYRCELCQKVVKPKTPCHHVTLEKRMFDHPYRPKVNKVYFIEEGKRKKEWMDDPGGRGYQITREVKACPECAVKKAKEDASEVL